MARGPPLVSNLPSRHEDLDRGIVMSPARIYRYVLRNQTTDCSLNLISQHRCFGDWTPGWEPPGAINAGEERGFQGESGTIVSGTEGWVKYGITNNSDGSIPGLIYLYWNNPYLGVTYQKLSLSGSDVRADCDPDEGSRGSTFGMPTASAPPSDLRLAITGTKRDGNPNVIDEIGDAYRIPLAPVFIFGAAGIWERMELDVDLRPVPVVSSPLFGASPTGPRTFKLMKKTATEDWSPRRRGHWSGKNIDVRVDHVDKGPELRFSPRHFIVSVDDQTPGWALQYSKSAYWMARRCRMVYCIRSWTPSPWPHLPTAATGGALRKRSEPRQRLCTRRPSPVEHVRSSDPRPTPM